MKEPETHDERGYRLAPAGSVHLKNRMQQFARALYPNCKKEDIDSYAAAFALSAAMYCCPQTVRALISAGALNGTAIRPSPEDEKELLDILEAGLT